jgi:hypothetical protein
MTWNERPERFVPDLAVVQMIALRFAEFPSVYIDSSSFFFALNLSAH